ncbi:endonuclease/exonuclease/phosphatase family protein [Salinarchaeum sp. IM2453]|uniref:endonuclease/exonuclease/phosphatase family protein n=1 Tax=Salinarchaeum sp. IM2453 TaxID=2862870 RepID=UPI001C837B1F|nr:endonuclease/exonuclease/phosphatase family protein [Salinarchaeum sp. IM2453]QZA88394.1 endonuclease/exonuclease/phosphatase family protein [Salinarchaeum sp. IM2453]
MTKLVTWNCNMAFREKKGQILRHDPDILVIQECESPVTSGDWSEFSDWLWIGENEHKGLGVFVRNGISLQPGNVTEPGGKFSLPVATDTSIDVLAVWAMNDKEHPENRYISQVYTSVRDYDDWIGSDTVVVGDFNWNIMWDESPNSPLRGDFSDTVRLLNDRGLRSVYHSVTESAFGDEDATTFYMHKKSDREYHIDYVFAHDEVIGSLSDFWIGRFNEWIDASDHMPIVIEI